MITYKSDLWLAVAEQVLETKVFEELLKPKLLDPGVVVCAKIPALEAEAGGSSSRPA